MYIWAVMHAFKQESISFFKTVREAKREFKALLVRVSAALFGDCSKDTMKLFKRGGKDIAKAWKLHPYHNELRLTFPLRKYIPSLCDPINCLPSANFLLFKARAQVSSEGKTSSFWLIGVWQTNNNGNSSRSTRSA